MRSTSLAQTGVLELGLSSKSGKSKNAGSFNNQLVEALAGSAIFREYQQAFEDATGLPLTLRAIEDWQLAHSGGRRQNGFCALMSQSNRSCAACLQMQQRVCDGANDTPCTMSCLFGLTETAIAVKSGGNIIGTISPWRW